MKNKVRCAVIGAGWWGTTAHIPALLRHPKAELLCVHHRDRDTARKIAHDFGIPLGVSCVDDVLAIDNLDAVVISSTVNMHYPQARAALERGLHVLVEKPMTFNAAQAKALVDLADEQGAEFLISGPWHHTEHACRGAAVDPIGRDRRSQDDQRVDDEFLFGFLSRAAVGGDFRGHRLVRDRAAALPETGTGREAATRRCAAAVRFTTRSPTSGGQTWHSLPVKNRLKCSRGLTTTTHVSMCTTR